VQGMVYFLKSHIFPKKMLFYPVFKFVKQSITNLYIWTNIRILGMVGLVFLAFQSNSVLNIFQQGISSLKP
jgi:hypothetical protein